MQNTNCHILDNDDIFEASDIDVKNLSKFFINKNKEAYKILGNDNTNRETDY